VVDGVLQSSDAGRHRARSLPHHTFGKPRNGFAVGRPPSGDQLAEWVTCDYHVTMTTVRIAELKSRLSEHLRKVRAGRSLTVLDRETPIARIVPWQDGDPSLKVRPPVPGAPRLHRVTLPPPLKLDRDIVELLVEERQGER